MTIEVRVLSIFSNQRTAFSKMLNGLSNMGALFEWFGIYKEITIGFQFCQVLPLMFYENVNKKIFRSMLICLLKILLTISHCITVVLCNDVHVKLSNLCMYF